MVRYITYVLIDVFCKCLLNHVFWCDKFTHPYVEATIKKIYFWLHPIWHILVTWELAVFLKRSSTYMLCCKPSKIVKIQNWKTSVQKWIQSNRVRRGKIVDGKPFLNESLQICIRTQSYVISRNRQKFTLLDRKFSQP